METGSVENARRTRVSQVRHEAIQVAMLGNDSMDSNVNTWKLREFDESRSFWVSAEWKSWKTFLYLLVISYKNLKQNF